MGGAWRGQTEIVFSDFLDKIKIKNKNNPDILINYKY